MDSPYEVFISFKKSDGNGNDTPDYEISKILYEKLVNEGFKVFFSDETVAEHGADNYAQLIEDALSEAKFLVAVTTKKEYINSPWVKFEWQNFVNDINAGYKPEGKVFTLYKDINPAQLPYGLKHRSAFEVGQIDLLVKYLLNARAKSNGDLDRNHLTPQIIVSNIPEQNEDHNIDQIKIELADFVRSQPKAYGKVYDLVLEGKSNKDISAQLKMGTGAVVNAKTIAKAMVDGIIPNGPTMVQQTASALNALIKTAKAQLTQPAYELLLANQNKVQAKRASLTEIGSSEPEFEVDPETELSQFLSDQDGVNGKVHTLLLQGKSNKEIIELLGINAGQLSNAKSAIRAILFGERPNAEALQKAALGAVNKLHHKGQGTMSPEALALLDSNRQQLA